MVQDGRQRWEHPHAVRVLLVDDQAASRQFAALRLGQHPGIAVVGEAASEAEAAALVSSLDPDVALLDLLLPGQPGQNGLVVARHLHDLSPRLRVLMTGHESSPGLDRIARGAGTAGFLPASALSPEALLALPGSQPPTPLATPQAAPLAA